MAWTTPVDQATGFLVTAAVYNAHIIDNLAYLHGDPGGVIDLSANSATYKMGALQTTTNSGVSTSGASSGVLRSFLVAGDTQPAFKIDQNGVVSWGVGGTTAPDTTASRAAAGIVSLSSKLFETFTNTGSITVPATYTPNLANGLFQKAVISAGGASTLTIAAPTNPPSASQTAFLIIRVSNNGGGTVTLSWNAAFVSNGTTVLPASIANAATSTSVFAWDGGAAKWVLLSVN